MFNRPKLMNFNLIVFMAKVTGVPLPGLHSSLPFVFLKNLLLIIIKHFPTKKPPEKAVLRLVYFGKIIQYLIALVFNKLPSSILASISITVPSLTLPIFSSNDFCFG